MYDSIPKLQSICACQEKGGTDEKKERNMAECKGSSTKQLKQCLGFWDLMGASVGQIIGAGIMTLLGAAIAMTGRSVPVAFLIAAVITICQYAPLVFIAGTVRLRGGAIYNDHYAYR